MKYLIGSLVVIAGVVVSGPAAAQNMRELPQGGRTATMGGVGVAAGVDAAMPLLNPAGLAGTPTDMLSVSADVYAATWIKIPKYFRPHGIDESRFGEIASVSQEDYSINHVESTPTGVAYFTRLGPPEDRGRHVLGVSLSVQSYLPYDPVGTFDATTSSGSLRHDVVTSAQFTQYLVGPSYAVRLGDRLRVGLSVLATYGRLTEDRHDTIFHSHEESGIAAPSSVNARARLDAYSIGLSAVVGAQARIARNVWAGAAFESRGIPLYGGGDVLQNQDVTTVDPSSGQVAQHQNVHVNFPSFGIRRPFRASLGVAYEAPRSFAVGADAHVSLPQAGLARSKYDANLRAFQTGSPPTEEAVTGEIKANAQTTFNGSLGGEVFLTNSVALRAGVYTDRDIVAAAGNDGTRNSRLDWYNATVGIGTYDGLFETTYGAALRYGVGKEYVPDYFNSGSPVGVNYHGWGVMVILSGSAKLEKEEKPAT